MPYDPKMAAQIRDLMAGTSGLVEQKMFGGIGWTVNGNMATGAHNDGQLMIRCAKEDFIDFLELPGANGMMRGGKAMTGWVLVEAATVADPSALAAWVDRGKTYAASLPPKKKKAKK